MKLASWMTLGCLIVFVSGCSGTRTTGNYCDIAFPITTADELVADTIIEHDKPLARELLAHNETWDDMCG